MLQNMERVKTSSCRRCDVESETPVHIPCECPTLCDKDTDLGFYPGGSELDTGDEARRCRGCL